MSDSISRPSPWMTLSAFGVIYLVWGSTFFAIRLGVAEVPPFLLAAMRFSAAGVALLAWTTYRRERWPTLKQWRSVAILSSLMFLVDYGLLFLAEKRVPSGIAAIVLATIPLFTTLAEIAILGTQRLTARLIFALSTGLAGVGVLALPSAKPSPLYSRRGYRSPLQR